MQKSATFQVSSCQQFGGQGHACHYMGILRVEELVDLREPALHVPEHDEAEGGRCGGLSLILVFENPVHRPRIVLRRACRQAASIAGTPRLEDTFGFGSTTVVLCRSVYDSLLLARDRVDGNIGAENSCTH